MNFERDKYKQQKFPFECSGKSQFIRFINRNDIRGHTATTTTTTTTITTAAAAAVLLNQFNSYLFAC
jgi:hypothetical protein